MEAIKIFESQEMRRLLLIKNTFIGAFSLFYCRTYSVFTHVGNGTVLDMLNIRLENGEGPI